MRATYQIMRCVELLAAGADAKRALSACAQGGTSPSRTQAVISRVVGLNEEVGESACAAAGPTTICRKPAIR